MRTIEQEELKHYGVKGMKWGVRRYQPYRKGSMKGKFIDANKRLDKKFPKTVAAAKKAEATKQARRVKNAKRFADANKRLDEKFPKKVAAAKKAEATKKARRDRQDARLKAVKDRERAAGEATVSKIKETASSLKSKVSKQVNKYLDKVIDNQTNDPIEAKVKENKAKAERMVKESSIRNKTQAQAIAEVQKENGMVAEYNKKHYKPEFANLKNPMANKEYQKYVEGFDKQFQEVYSGMLEQNMKNF